MTSVARCARRSTAGTPRDAVPQGLLLIAPVGVTRSSPPSRFRKAALGRSLTVLTSCEEPEHE